MNSFTYIIINRLKYKYWTDNEIIKQTNKQTNKQTHKQTNTPLPVKLRGHNYVSARNNANGIKDRTLSTCYERHGYLIYVSVMIILKVYLSPKIFVFIFDKIKRKLSFNQSESRIKGLRLIFLICVQTQIFCNGARDTF